MPSAVFRISCIRPVSTSLCAPPVARISMRPAVNWSARCWTERAAASVISPCVNAMPRPMGLAQPPLEPEGRLSMTLRIALLLSLFSLLAGCVSSGDVDPMKSDKGRDEARDAYVQLGVGYLQQGDTERAKTPLR